MDFDDEPFNNQASHDVILLHAGHTVFAELRRAGVTSFLCSMLRINTERVIRAVEKHPCLWNTTHHDYRDRERKQEAWQVVAQMVIQNFEKLPQFEKSNAERYIRSRWRTARDAYNKSRNSASNPNQKGRKYVYANRMKFLDGNAGAVKKNNGLIRPETVNLKEEDTTFSDEDNEISNDSINMTVESNLLEEDDPFSETAIRPESSCSFASKTRRRSEGDNDGDPRKIFGMVSEVMEMFRNDDLAFFVSLLPMISTFDVDDKLTLRSEVLKIVARIREVKREPKDPTENRASLITTHMMPSI